MIEYVMRWVNKLPKGERDNPLIILNGKIYTPNQVIEEINNNTELGAALQSEIEKLELENESLELLVMPRIKKKFENIPLDEPYVYFINEEGMKSYYTSREIIEAVEKKTKEGTKFIEDEKRYVRYLLKLR